MPDPELNIKVSINSSEATAGSRKVSESVKDLSTDLKKFGKDLSQVSRELVQFSSAITGGFALAFANARKDIPAVNREFLSLTNSFQSMSDSIATAALPTLQEFSNFMNNVAVSVGNFARENQELVNQVLKISAMTLAFTTFSFALAKVLKFLGELGILLRSVFLIFANVQSIVVTLTIGVLLLADAIDGLRGVLATAAAGFTGFGASAANALARSGLLKFLGIQGGPSQGTSLVAGLQNQVNNLRNTFSGLFNTVQNQAPRSIDLLGKFTEGFKSQIDRLSDSVQQFGVQFEQALENNLGDTIFQAITGKIESLRSLIVSLGEDIARAFSRFAANEVLRLIFGAPGERPGIFGGFGSLFGSGRAAGGGPGSSAAANLAAQEAVDQSKRVSRTFSELVDNMKLFAKVKDEVIENLRKFSRQIQETSASTRGIGGAEGGNLGTVDPGAVSTTGIEGVQALNETLTETAGLVGYIDSGFAQVAAKIINLGKVYATVQAFMLAITVAASAVTRAVVTALAKSLAAAWLPAAVLASIATLGVASVIGIGALTGALAGAGPILNAFSGGNSGGGDISVGGGIGGDGGGFNIENVKAPEAGSLGVPSGKKKLGFGLFADGGIVDRPTLAIIGEAGPEAVIPLKPDSRKSLPSSGSGGMKIINLHIAEAKLNSPSNMREFVKYLSEEIARA